MGATLTDSIIFIHILIWIRRFNHTRSVFKNRHLMVDDGMNLPLLKRSYRTLTNDLDMAPIRAASYNVSPFLGNPFYGTPL